MIVFAAVEQTFETREAALAWVDRVDVDGLLIDGQVMKANQIGLSLDAGKPGYTVHADFGDNRQYYDAGDEPEPEDAGAPEKVQG